MIDSQALLAPISEDAPAGESLAFSPLLDELNEARREDMAGTTSGIWKTDAKRADWAQVFALASQGLATRSKDLQLAVALTEALLHKDGLEGFAQGLDLLTGLSQAFWDSLYPQLDEGDLDARLAPFAALENRVVPVLLLMPLTDQGGGVQEGRYGQQDMLNAQRMEPLSSSNPKAYKAALNSGHVPVATIVNAASRTSTEFFYKLLDGLRLAEEAVARLRAVLLERCGRDTPSFAKLSGALGQVQQTIIRLGAGRLSLEAPAKTAEEVGVSDEEVGVSEPARMPGRITSRDDAYRYLTEASNYLLATEPHSPVPYLIKRAIRWGELPLGTLLNELLEDDDRTKKLFKLLSIE